MVVSIRFANRVFHVLRLFRRHKRHPALIWSDFDEQSERGFLPTYSFRRHGMFEFTSDFDSRARCVLLLLPLRLLLPVLLHLSSHKRLYKLDDWQLHWHCWWKLCRCTQGSICRFPPPHGRTNESALIWLCRTFSTVKAQVSGWFSSLHSYFFFCSVL